MAEVWQKQEAKRSRLHRKQAQEEERGLAVGGATSSQSPPLTVTHFLQRGCTSCGFHSPLPTLKSPLTWELSLWGAFFTPANPPILHPAFANAERQREERSSSVTCFCVYREQDSRHASEALQEHKE